jgi:hypothetical protein
MGLSNFWLKNVEEEWVEMPHKKVRKKVSTALSLMSGKLFDVDDNNVINNINVNIVREANNCVDDVYHNNEVDDGKITDDVGNIVDRNIVIDVDRGSNNGVNDVNLNHEVNDEKKRQREPKF